MTHEARIALLRAQPGETISPGVLAEVLGGKPYTYNVMAKNGQLSLPHIWRGRNLRVFKQPLIELLTKDLLTKVK